VAAKVRSSGAKKTSLRKHEIRRGGGRKKKSKNFFVETLKEWKKRGKGVV